MPVRQPYAGVDFIPQSGTYEFGYSTLTHGPTVLLGDAVCRHLGFAEGAVRVFHVETLAEPLPDHLKERIQARSPSALYRKSDLCIPRNKIVRPCSQFLHSYICERFIYSPDWSAYLAVAK